VFSDEPEYIEHALSVGSSVTRCLAYDEVIAVSFEGLSIARGEDWWSEHERAKEREERRIPLR
jgi:hypothetical protein